jgi:hypothetical protein
MSDSIGIVSVAFSCAQLMTEFEVDYTTLDDVALVGLIENAQAEALFQSGTRLSW